MMQRVLLLRRLRGARGAVSGLRSRMAPPAHVSRGAAQLLRAPEALYVAQEPLHARHSRRWLSTTSAASSDLAEAVALLKTRCNALYNDKRVAPPAEEALAAWRRDVSALLAPHAQVPSDLRVEICLAYESGVAIASKQRQFALATALTEQMRSLGLAPTPRTHRFLVRNVALELLAPPCVTPRKDIKALLAAAGARWEREILTIVRSEERSFYQKPRSERQLLQQRLLTGVHEQLDVYERDCEDATLQKATTAVARSSEPYNEALRVLATHQTPFSALLDILLSRPLAADASTYAALLSGARDAQVPAVLTRLLASGVVDALASDPESSSEQVAALWEAASAAVTRSAAAKLAAKRDGDVRHQDVARLRRVAAFADKQLSRAFPRFAFTTPETHPRVYAARVRAAASCGQQPTVLRLLDEYAGSPDKALDLAPYQRALELFPWSPLELLLLTRQDALARAELRDVAHSRRVHELQRVHARVASRLARAKELLHASKSAGSDKESREEAAARRLASRVVQRESRAVEALERRLQDARVLKALQLLSEEHLARGDAAVAAVRAKLTAVRALQPQEELALACTLMEQYAQSAVRFQKRLAARHKAVGPHVMRRVFALVEAATAGELDVQDAVTRQQLTQLFEAALRTATLLWRREDAAALVRKQRRVLGDSSLLPAQYDHLIFLRVTDGDIRGAYALLQEMHNAGLAPSQDAIHRVAMGLLHLLVHDPERAQRLQDGLEGLEDGELDEAQQDQELQVEEEDAQLTTESEDEDEELELELSDEEDEELAAVLSESSQDAIERELGGDGLRFQDDEDATAVAEGEARAALLGSGAPTREEDLADFLQDWYNLYGVRPASKTAVPVLARLLATRNMPEFKRMLQLLEAMDGGLSPATQAWLERRLAQIGDKTLADYRL